MIEGTNAFTSCFQELSNKLTNEVTIFANEGEMTVLALWDTGATNSCISQKVVTNLGLIPTGKVNLQSSTGVAERNTYLIDIKLPNNVAVNGLQVSDSEIDSSGIDMLIGMDIISEGDFAVSNFNEKTVFTFRIPSNERTDYVQQVNRYNLMGKPHGKGKRKRKKR